MILDRFRMDGRVGVVTGAGRGIGAACALGLAEAGADVVISSRTKDELEEVAEKVRALGRRALVLPADLSETANLARLTEGAISEFGRIDAVVNNAGGTGPRPFLDTSERMFEKAFHFNVTTAFELSRLAAPHLIESGSGAIVNIGSTMGRLADRGYIAYGTAKAALHHMTKLMATDLAPRVRVNAISVGSVETAALAGAVSNDAIRDELVNKTPLRRLGQPEDIAIAALYLCAPAASYVTGKVFEIDGGLESPNFDLRIPDL